MIDMRRAVQRIRRAIANSESIAVYGDYDADGVCATALLLETPAKSSARKPRRISPTAMTAMGSMPTPCCRLAEDGVKLVVTVDCGIRSVAEAAAGNAAGLDIIITDHHSLGAALPAGAGGRQSAAGWLPWRVAPVRLRRGFHAGAGAAVGSLGDMTATTTRRARACPICLIWSRWALSRMSCRWMPA